MSQTLLNKNDISSFKSTDDAYVENTSGLDILYLAEDWMLLSYWISGRGSDRRRFQKFLEKHGLSSLESRKGSVYLGRRNQTLDSQISEQAESIKKKLKGLCKITMLPAHYAPSEVKVMTEGVLATALADLKTKEEAVRDVEEVLANGGVLKNKRGKELDLLLTGAGRLQALEHAIEATSGMLTRFMGSGEEKKTSSLGRKMQQVEIWHQLVKKNFDKWATTERIRRRSERMKKGNEEIV